MRSLLHVEKPLTMWNNKILELVQKVNIYEQHNNLFTDYLQMFVHSVTSHYHIIIILRNDNTYVLNHI